MLWSWLGSLLLIAAAWLLLDAAAGFAGWQGLRSTVFGPRAVLGLGAASLGFAVLMLWAAPLAVPLVCLLLAPLFHAGLATLVSRNVVPDPWSTAGTYSGHRVSAVEIPACDGVVPALLYEPHEPSSGAIVVIHGAGAHKSFYSWPMVEALLQGGFSVCAIDLAGHGASRRVLDLPAAIEDVRASVSWLRSRATWIGLVGISLGGCVAARAAADGVVVDSLAILESPASITVSRRIVRNEWRTIVRRGTWGLHRYAGTLPLVRAWRTKPTHSRVSTIDLIRDLDLLGSVARVRCPLWLCYGGADLVAPRDAAQRIAAAAPAGTTLRVIPRATHLSLPLDWRALQALCRWLLDVRNR
jgi:alpha-beta hydrolase superfamily lysophospholipase